MAKISLDEYFMAILLQVGYTVGYLMISPVMERVNRTHLFMTAASLMTLALSVLASQMPNVDDDGTSSSPMHIQLLMPISVILFSVCYGAGFGPAIYTWSSELFPPRGRSVGCSLSLSVRYIVVGMVLKVYPWLLHSLGLSHLFILHACVLIIGILFVAFVVPETRGLTLTELATLFGGKVKTQQQQPPDSESTMLTLS